MQDTLFVFVSRIFFDSHRYSNFCESLANVNELRSSQIIIQNLMDKVRDTFFSLRCSVGVPGLEYILILTEHENITLRKKNRQEI